MEQRNVVSEVVAHNLCIGCGLCAGVCPGENLSIDWNGYGEYNPLDRGNCLETCSLCLKVCPFADDNDNEDTLGEKLFGAIPNIQHTKETGYYLQSYIGYGPNRDIAASGGLTSFLLEKLLQRGLINKVACVSPTDDSNALFQYRIIETPEEIRKSTGSAYYPVHLAKVVRFILENPSNYAITALPCFAKALRLAAEANPVLKERVKFILGLVCGQLKSSFYTKYIASLAGINEPLRRCYFREKAADQPANNFAFTCQGISGRTGRIRWNEGVSQVWTSRWFTPLACNFCDDIFAELADVVFMDAWLPGYREDPKGTNLLIVRNLKILELLKETINRGSAELHQIPLSQIIRSQRGVIKIKRQQLFYRKYRAIERGQKTPVKRVPSANLIFGPLQKREIELLDKMQKLSRKCILDIQKDNFNHDEIQKQLLPYLIALNKLRCIKNIYTVPIRAIKKLAQMIKITN